MPFFTTTYDIIIVGGGISGLFLAYKLRNTNLNILLIEQNKNLGGRIQTKETDDIQYEAGAGRFNENHTKLISLINELNISDKIIPLSKHVDKKLRKYNTNYKLNINYLFDVMEKKYKNYDKDYLVNITLLNFLTEIFDYETASFLKDSMGYDSEFVHLNAYSAISMFKDDLFKNTQYYVLKDGFSNVIKLMEQKIKKNKNITILKNNTLKKIYNDKIITSIDDYYYKNLILCIPQYNLKQLDEFKDFKLLDSVKPINLLRIYAKYPVPDKGVWFKDIKRTTTDNYLRHIIPINYQSGVIMITYTDGFITNVFSDLRNNGDEALMKAIHKEIKKLFNITPPEPLKVYFHHWKDEYAGAHFWKTQQNHDELYEKILQPDVNKNVFICGESYSKKQAWIEGALETSYDVLKKLKLDNIDVDVENNL